MMGSVKMIMDSTVVKNVIHLLDGFRNGDADKDGLDRKERLEPEDFLQMAFRQKKFDDAVTEPVAELFFKVIKYERLLDLILDDYYGSRTQRFPRVPNDRSVNMVFLYYAVFELTPETLADIHNLFKEINMNKAVAVTSYMKKSSFPSKVFECGTQIWDIDYVRKLLEDVMKNPLFRELYNALSNTATAAKKSRLKKPTKPIEFKLSKKIEKNNYRTMNELVDDRTGNKFVELEQESTTRIPYRIKPTPIPKMTYIKPDYEKRLEQDRLKHQEQARELYEEAQKKSFRVANLPKQKEPEPEPMCFVGKDVHPPRRIPIYKEPSIQPKKTAAVILREGARLMKIEQDEIRRLEDLVRGAFNSESLKVLEREMEEERTRKHMEEIEKKHLQGLLTYEEALIAKQKFLKKTKEGAEKFRKEKEAWMKKLEEWRAEEQSRIRESVEKGKSSEKGAKEAMEHVKEEKHRIALETMEESKSLKEKWLSEKEEELKRKIQLIKEIKALQAFGIIRRKEKVANNFASIGLLCEMSTEELKERLLVLRFEFQKEVERRREEVKQKRECRKAIVEGYEGLIQQHYEIRREKQRIEQQTERRRKSPVRSSSVEALKKKLDEKRKERLRHFTTCRA